MITEDQKQVILDWIQFGGDSAEADKIFDEIDANGISAEFTAWLFTAWLDSVYVVVYPEASK